MMAIHHGHQPAPDLFFLGLGVVIFRVNNLFTFLLSGLHTYPTVDDDVGGRSLARFIGDVFIGDDWRLIRLTLGDMSTDSSDSVSGSSVASSSSASNINCKDMYSQNSLTYYQALL